MAEEQDDTMLYTVDVDIRATVYVRASSPQEALEAAVARLKEDEEVSLDGELVCALPFDDPDLPDVSMSPAATIDWKTMTAEGVFEV